MNFLLPTTLKRELEKRADEMFVSTSHLLRQLVRSYLKSAEAPADIPAPSARRVGSDGKRKVRDLSAAEIERRYQSALADIRSRRRNESTNNLPGVNSSQPIPAAAVR